MQGLLSFFSEETALSGLQKQNLHSVEFKFRPLSNIKRNTPRGVMC